MEQTSYNMQFGASYLENRRVQQNCFPQGLNFQVQKNNSRREHAQSHLYEFSHSGGVWHPSLATSPLDVNGGSSSFQMHDWPSQSKFGYDRQRNNQEQLSASQNNSAQRTHSNFDNAYCFDGSFQAPSDHSMSHGLSMDVQRISTISPEGQQRGYYNEYGQADPGLSQPTIANAGHLSPDSGTISCFINPNAYTVMPPTPAHTDIVDRDTPKHDSFSGLPSLPTPSTPIKVESSPNLFAQSSDSGLAIPYPKGSGRQSVASSGALSSHKTDLSEEKTGCARAKREVGADESVPRLRECQSQQDDQILPPTSFETNFEGPGVEATFLSAEWPIDDFEFLECWNFTTQNSFSEETKKELLNQEQNLYFYPPLPSLEIQNDEPSNFNIFDDNPAPELLAPQGRSGYHLADSLKDKETLLPDLFGNYKSTANDPALSPPKNLFERSPDRPNQRDKDKDRFLIECKDNGWSYKDIKAVGCFEEAESTLRGRYRTLTKRKEERLRKPEWGDREINLLLEAVNLYNTYAWDPTGRRSSGLTRRAAKIPWKQVAEYMALRGAYRYGNATVKKKWLEVIGERCGW